MAKKFVLLLFLISAMTAALSQEFTREYADSIRIALKKSSTDLNRIDLLLSLAQFYIFKPGEFQVDFDSARRYINEAQQLNKKVQSRDVMGYILLTESSIIKELGDWARGEEMNHQALKILEPGTNKTYLGRAYYRLSEYYDYKDSLENFKKIELVEKAIAAFERTIISGNTAWDRYRAGDQSALSASATRGWNIFVAIKCNNCHDGVLFTDQQYHNIGIGMDQQTPDAGRFTVTKKPEDTGAFKTPTLRDIARSAPYFHDGSAKTLEEAVDIMLAGGKPNEHLDKKNLQPHKILPEQREDLLNFLRSLSVDCNLTKPPIPQK